MKDCQHKASEREVVVTYPFNDTFSVHFPRVLVVCKVCGKREEARGDPLWK